MRKQGGDRERGAAMSNLFDRVARSIFTDDQLAAMEGRRKNHEEDCARFATMTDAQLAEEATRFLSNCERCRWQAGEPVYDAVVWHAILPEMIRRLRD